MFRGQRDGAGHMRSSIKQASDKMRKVLADFARMMGDGQVNEKAYCSGMVAGSAIASAVWVCLLLWKPFLPVERKISPKEEICLMVREGDKQEWAFEAKQAQTFRQMEREKRASAAKLAMTAASLSGWGIMQAAAGVVADAEREADEERVTAERLERRRDRAADRAMQQCMESRT